MIEQHGLTAQEVLVNRLKYGVNVLTPVKKETLWDSFKACFAYWLIRVLVLLLVVSCVLFTFWTSAPDNIWIGTAILGILLIVSLLVALFGGLEDHLITILIYALLLSGGITFYEIVWTGAGYNAFFEPIGIIIALLLATGISFFLERHNEKTFQSLNEVNDETHVKVMRDGNICEVERKEIVFGDIVILETGEEIPADCELLEALNLTVNESSLTGEPLSHKTTNEKDFEKDATYPSNYIMKGCTIIEGYCVAKVFAVGDHTACGKVFEAAQVQEGNPTPLSRKLEWLAKVIAKASYLVAFLIIVGRLIMYFTTYTISDSESALNFVEYLLHTIMIAVTLIVVSVPEGLPMSVSLSLALSMKKLMDQNTLPRTMHACETMGATSVICTDKTGTLTQNQMQVHDTHFALMPPSIIYECVAVNTTANLDFSDPTKIKAIGNPTEGALLLWLHSKKADYLTLREQNTIVDRLPFSTELKYMATIVQSQELQKRVLYVKGAPEIVLSMTNTTEMEKKQYLDQLLTYQNKAMRTLAFAYLPLTDDQVVFANGKLATNQLKMMGIVAISDPIRKEVPNAIRECIEAGIQVKIVTGDTPGTAKEIGRQVGIWTENDTEDNLLTGQEVEQMSDEELRERLLATKIVSRARPNNKERIVRTLQKMNYVVAVTGDGTNDAPALNVADVGLSMGDGTAVAKEASDMTILDNSFSTITNAVMWGRSLYKNIQRFILFQLTINVVACLVVLVGAFTGTESPLTVTQMLWVNLVMDSFAALAFASLAPSKNVMHEKPRTSEEPIISKPMAQGIFGIGGILAIFLLGVLFFFQYTDFTSLKDFTYTWTTQKHLSAYELTLFFTTFVMFQFWNLFNAKAFMTGKSALLDLNPKTNRWFVITTIVVIVGQFTIVQFGGDMFNVQRGGLGLMDWLIIIGLTSLVLWIVEGLKRFPAFKEI